MLTTDILSSLVYLDRDFVAGRYEILSGVSPNSQITKAQGKKAGATIPVFSGEVSAVETRTFSVSSLEMLATVMPALKTECDLESTSFRRNMPSKTGWVNATLATLTVATTRRQAGSEEYVKQDEQGYFTLEASHGLKLALITVPDYFVSGLDALTKMHQVLVRDLAMPVRALVRVIAAQSYLDQWIAVPYIMFENLASSQSGH
jgi:hypothetical protein